MVVKNITSKQKDEFRKTIQKALKVLNKKNLFMIVHGSSFPSVEGQNLGIGSPNAEGGKNFIEFLQKLGFNGIQFGPEGKTKSIDASPYISTMFSNNPLFIDLFALTQKEFGEILSSETFERIVNSNTATANRTAYGYIYNEHNEALKEAFSNFVKQLEEKKSKIKTLNTKLNKFKKENNYWLEKDALYDALSVKHNNDYWPKWNDELDKNLFNSEAGFPKEESEARIAELKKDYKDDIEYYEFIQFLADIQKQKTKDFILNKKMKTIADCQVAFSDRDCWANQELFLPGYSLGCPPDCFSADGQAWGFPVINPDKLFNADGSLSEGGNLLKARFTKMFKENSGGVRIDHIIGLIDPFVYKSDSLPKPDCGASRLFSSPEHGELAKFSYIRVKDLNHEVGPENEKRVAVLNEDQIKDYARILENIVMKSAEELGIGRESIICEDLGTITKPVEAVMEQFNLSGIRMTQFVDPLVAEHPYRIKSTEPQHWAMIGSHDNQPLMSWVDEIYWNNQVEPHINNLASDLRDSKVEEFKQEMRQNSKLFVKAKFAELFASPAENIQVFFADFFGTKDRYNMPGTAGDQNWSLRVSDDYESYYYSQLLNEEAMNLPEILILAIESKGNKFVFKHQEIIKKLRKSAELFKN